MKIHLHKAMQSFAKQSDTDWVERWISRKTVFRTAKKQGVTRFGFAGFPPWACGLGAGNFMGNRVTSWCNPQNAPPSHWKGLTDGP